MLGHITFRRVALTQSLNFPQVNFSGLLEEALQRKGREIQFHSYWWKLVLCFSTPGIYFHWGNGVNGWFGIVQPSSDAFIWQSFWGNSFVWAYDAEDSSFDRSWHSFKWDREYLQCPLLWLIPLNLLCCLSKKKWRSWFNTWGLLEQKFNLKRFFARDEASWSLWPCFLSRVLAPSRPLLKVYPQNCSRTIASGHKWRLLHRHWAFSCIFKAPEALQLPLPPSLRFNAHWLLFWPKSKMRDGIHQRADRDQ